MNEIIFLSLSLWVVWRQDEQKKKIEIKVEDGALAGFNVSLTIH